MNEGAGKTKQCIHMNSEKYEYIIFLSPFTADAYQGQAGQIRLVELGGFRGLLFSQTAPPD